MEKTRSHIASCPGALCKSHDPKTLRQPLEQWAGEIGLALFEQHAATDISDRTPAGVVAVAKDCDLLQARIPRAACFSEYLEKVCAFIAPLLGIRITTVRDIVRKGSDELPFTPAKSAITPDDLRVARLPVVAVKGQKEPDGVIVAGTFALIALAGDRLFDEPAPGQSGKPPDVDIRPAREHGGAGIGFATQGRHALLRHETDFHRLFCPEFAVHPAGRQIVEGQRLRKIHHGNRRVIARCDRIDRLA